MRGADGDLRGAQGAGSPARRGWGRLGELAQWQLRQPKRGACLVDRAAAFLQNVPEKTMNVLAHRGGGEVHIRGGARL